MRTLYLILVITICISMILFVATLLYIDTHRHATFFYKIYKDKRTISTTKIDKYNTDEKLVYKSITYTPFCSMTDKYKRKLSIIKKGFRVDSYNKKRLSEGVSMDVYIKRRDSTINFLAVGHSDFAYAQRLPVNKDFAIFEEEAPISYFNLIDKYDFKKSGVQYIDTLTHTYTFLPPYKSRVEMQLAKEDNISIGKKKFKALLFEIITPTRDKVFVWVKRWIHVPLVIKIPSKSFEAIWQPEQPKELIAKRYVIETTCYENKEITFKNKDITLVGTLSMPKSGGPYPAVVLVWGPGPQDRDGFGMLADIADGLAQNGIVALRFDKRGVGKSKGNFSKFTGEDLIDDISSAIDFLVQQKEIDKKKIALLGHSEGGYYAAYLAANNPNVSACIILSGMETVNLPDTELEMIWSFDKSAISWNKEYLKDIAKCAKDTAEVLNNKKDWALLMYKRVYLKKRRLDIKKRPLEIIRKVKVPILILRGKKDNVILPEHIKLLEETLKESGNKNYEIVYFNRLNHFFGKKIEDGVHRTHLSIDKEVIDTIVKWLNKNLISPPLPKLEQTEKTINIEENKSQQKQEESLSEQTDMSSEIKRNIHFTVEEPNETIKKGAI